MLLRRSIWIFFAFCASILTAQDLGFLRGKVLDQETGEPVVFATARVKGKAKGVITNMDGGFRLPMYLIQNEESIKISSMGYQSKTIELKNLSPIDINIIRLNQGVLSLNEAVVRGRGKRRKRLSPVQIVQKAIDAIKSNYPTTSFSTIGYYRDYQLKKEDYINLNEGIMEVFDQGFDQLDDDTSQIQVFNFELNKDFEIDTMARMAYNYKDYRKTIKKAYLGAYGGNEFRILRIHDAIRNYNAFSYDYIGTLKNDFIENHTFLRSKDTESDGESLYGIKFFKRYPNYRAHGEIFIAKSDFAVHKLEYTMYDNRRTYKEKNKNKHGHKQKVIFDVLTEYSRLNEKMYLNYISFHNNFEVRRPPKFALDSTFVNMPGGYYALYFSKAVDSITAVNPKNYEMMFQKKKYGIDKIEVFSDSIRIYGDSDFKQAVFNAKGETSSLINKRRANEVEDMFEIGIDNVRDINGNLVNKPNIKEYQQYREFFAQRIKPDSRSPLNGAFMDKKKPIFDDQPKVKPKDYNEYWMNTPLLKIIN